MTNKFFLQDLPVDYVYDLRSDVANGEEDEVKAWNKVIEWLDSPEFVTQDGFKTGLRDDEENPEEADFLRRSYLEAELMLEYAQNQKDAEESNGEESSYY